MLFFSFNKEASSFLFFFFQAEDGIRDGHVTGVQTCALPIFLRRFAEQGRTVLVASHMLAEVAQTVDQVVIINRGRRVASGRLDELTGCGKTLEDTYLELTDGES